MGVRDGPSRIRHGIVVMQDAPVLPGGDAERRMLDFRTLTFVPIDRRLIDAEVLSAGERDWLNAYHAEVRAKIGPRVSDGAREWLLSATEPL